jgi:hypothetical protein
MSSFIPPPAIVASIITITVGALFALLGIVYRSLKTSIDDVEATSGQHDERLGILEKRVRTLFFWAFGNEEDATDQGFAHDIQQKLAELNTKLETMEANEQAHHDELVDRLDEVILRLDEEEALDIERDDFE